MPHAPHSPHLLLLPRCPQMITRPMDLGTVERRLSEGFYKLPNNVLADVGQVGGGLCAVGLLLPACVCVCGGG
jgi:hypothetical protein